MSEAIRLLTSCGLLSWTCFHGRLIQGNERVASVSAVNMKFIFESMLEKALVKAKAREREMAKYGDERDQAFHALLSRNLITSV